jgi:hypothetical protein
MWQPSSPTALPSIPSIPSIPSPNPHNVGSTLKTPPDYPRLAIQTSAMNSIIITANLGHLKAYRFLQTPTRGPKLEVVEELVFLEAHGRFSDKVDDKAARHHIGERVGVPPQIAPIDNSRAVLETQQRLIKLVAEKIETILTRERPEIWDFAATSENQKAILEKLSPGLRERLRWTDSADLTKVPPEKVLPHFTAGG